MSPKKDATSDDTLPAVIRVPKATHDRLVRVRAAMSKRALTELPDAVVVRAVLDRGLDALESELGIPAAKRKT